MPQPAEGVVVKEQDAGELPRGIAVGPVHHNAAVLWGIEDVGIGRWLESARRRKSGGFFE